MVLGLAVAGCAARTATSEEAISSVTEAVQIRNVSTSETGTGKFANVVQNATQTQEAATGAIRFLGTNGLHYVCGATFLSPHFAVTAAHCIDGTIIPSTFAVEQYNVSTLAQSKIVAQDAVNTSRGWPDWYRGTTMTSSDGYNVTSYGCTVKVRCSTGYGGRVNCPFSTSVDIGLIQCSGRASNGAWVPVATSDSGTDNLDVWWFHEVLELPDDPPSSGSDPKWDHYGSYTTEGNNYHYAHTSVDLDQQLLPLKSSNWADGTPYKGLGHVSNGLTTMSNVFACHGTSGSGTFSRGSTMLYGPVDLGPAFGNSRLCADQEDYSKTTDVMEYIQRTWTEKIQATSFVQNDR